MDLTDKSYYIGYGSGTLLPNMMAQTPGSVSSLTTNAVSAPKANIDGFPFAPHEDEWAALNPKMYADPKVISFSLESVAIRIARLKQGWAGGESVCPPDGVFRDLVLLASILPPTIEMPDVEVDPDDGDATLLWKSNVQDGLFAIVCRGNGAITGMAPMRSGYRPWRILLSDEIGILKKLEADDSLGRFFC